MEFAILFWFYKDAELCENRLRILRTYNPDVPIYGLFGGDLSKLLEYERLNTYLDDLFVFDQDRDSRWKWRHGDVMITEWFKHRGHFLKWNTLVIVQWDMLLYGHVKKIFKRLGQSEMLLSGLRPIAEVVPKWTWVNPENSVMHKEYVEFINHVRSQYAFHADPLCCLFIVAALPRTFLEKYSMKSVPELGFLEYKIPIYGQIFGIRLTTQHCFDPWWDDLEPRKADTTLAAVGRDIDWKVVFLNFFLVRGRRVFHPYRSLAPISRIEWTLMFLSKLFHATVRVVRHVLYC